MTVTPAPRVFAVPDISCEHCVNSITEHLAPLEGVESVEVDLTTKTVTVLGGDEPSIVAAIDNAGYDVA